MTSLKNANFTMPWKQALLECMEKHQYSETYNWIFKHLKELLQEDVIITHVNDNLDKLVLAQKYDSNTCILVNGEYREDISTLAEDIIILPLSKARVMFPAFFLKYDENIETHPLAYLNSIVETQGLFLYVPAGACYNKPITILHIFIGKDEGACISYTPNIFIGVGSGSCVQFNVQYKTLSGDNLFVNSLCNGFLEEGAQVKIDIDFNRSESIYNCISSSWALSQNSQCLVYSHIEEIRGNSFLDCRMHFLGTAAYGEVICKTLSPEKLYIKTFMEHFAEYTGSKQVIRSVLDNDSQMRFFGEIFIPQTGQFTKAYQSHDTILLSNQAKVETNPRLHIYADEVKASHGATVGPLNRDILFYLLSRGFTNKSARDKLLKGFLNITTSKDYFHELKALGLEV